MSNWKKVAKEKRQRRPPTFTCERVCVVCGYGFTPAHSQQICCSLRCKRLRIKATKHQARRKGYAWRKERRCTRCERAFVPRVRKQEYCSPGCRMEQAIDRQREDIIRSSSWKKERPCSVCSEPFVPHVRRAKYCSEQCRNWRDWEGKYRTAVLSRVGERKPKRDRGRKHGDFNKSTPTKIKIAVRAKLAGKGTEYQLAKELVPFYAAAQDPIDSAKRFLKRHRQQIESEFSRTQQV